MSEQLESKLDIVGEYRFTEGEPHAVDVALVNVTARYWGKFSGHARAEPLERCRGPEGDEAPHRHPLLPTPKD